MLFTDDDGGWDAVCKECGAYGPRVGVDGLPHESESDALYAWNMRTDSAKQSKLISMAWQAFYPSSFFYLIAKRLAEECAPESVAGIEQEWQSFQEARIYFLHYHAPSDVQESAYKKYLSRAGQLAFTFNCHETFGQYADKEVNNA